MKKIIVNCETGETIEIDVTDDEIAQGQQEATATAWEILRRERNVLLVASDWTQIADAPVDKYTWAEYRQALRDLPANTTDPFDPVWPTPPA